MDEPSRSDDDEEGAAALRADEEEISSQNDELKDRCDRQHETIRILKGQQAQMKSAVEGAQAAMMRAKKDHAALGDLWTRPYKYKYRTLSRLKYISLISVFHRASCSCTAR